MKNNHQIDISLIFFSLAFVIVLLGLFTKFAFQKNEWPNNNGQKILITSSPKKINKKIQSINFNNPIKCNFVNSDASISGQLEGTYGAIEIQNKTETQKIIIEEDCIYSWIQTEKIGKKQCGAGQYLSIGKQLLGSGLVSSDFLNSIIKKMGINMPIDFEKLMQSCENVKKIEKDVFQVPKNMTFVE